MSKITYTFTQTNQPSSSAIQEFNQHVHQLLKNPMYCQAKKGHSLAETAHSTQTPAKS
ncbi:hypothetical protein [Dendrosporobacter sp. 1207_IL3150]|uniref:hypothetical protein n=1 Tax=Dendrosporobacter sp. 1207_IL3150 TaxID=3084054 RepID=UPI002FDAE56C